MPSPRPPCRSLWPRSPTTSACRQLDAARRDPLSGLPGRPDLSAFTDRMLNTRRRADLHLMLLDANGFKAVNDTYGHAAGDAVIRTMGQRLARWTSGRQAVAAQLGGDEFAVAAVLPSSSDLADIAALRDQLQQPLHHDGLTLQIDVSLGIARADDLPGETTDRILRAADAAMYKVKTGDRRSRT
ncbi:GGDEF domain-containing protein [Streptomyces sp. NPDC056309]|uniref:GGDEF domain-containing protein n=1 Tax=unclassified Streptomyces TaxID=2593676 RepID=UPI0035D66AB5